MEDHSPSPPCPTDIPEDAINAKVPLDALYQVLHHGENASGDSHRFSVSADPEDATSKVGGQVRSWSNRIHRNCLQEYLSPVFQI